MRKKTVISYTGVINDVVEVDSKAYGKHYRRPRGSKTPVSINSSFEKSIELNNLANPIAKAIKDAIDPFRRDMKDGTMWSRLVGLLKKHLRTNPKIDFRILEDFPLYKKVRVHGDASYNLKPLISVINPELPAIHIEISSSPRDIHAKYDRNYLQTVIIIFLDAKHKATTHSDKAIFPIKKLSDTYVKGKKYSGVYRNSKQVVDLIIPSEAVWALVVVKNEVSGNKLAPVKLKKIKIVKAVELVRDELILSMSDRL